jgi:hypothetical protein
MINLFKKKKKKRAPLNPSSPFPPYLSSPSFPLFLWGFLFFPHSSQLGLGVGRKFFFRSKVGKVG